MRLRVTGIVLLAGLLVWGAAALFLEPSMATVRAQDPYQESEEEYAPNPVIDCSTNPGYRDTFVAEAFRATETKTSGGQACSACHGNDHPVVGSGKPRATQATILVQNRSTKPVQYQVRSALKGHEWKEYTLKPGYVQRFTMPYTQAGQRSSAVYQLKYSNDPAQRVRKLVPMATPNPKLGNVYFFDSENQQTFLYKPNATVARGGR